VEGRGVSRRSALELVGPVIRRPRILHRVPGAAATVALTFDDGPGPWTEEIADALERSDCRGTFFVLGAAVERDPERVRELAAAGHELGNHLWSHRDPAQQSRRAIRAELLRTSAALRDAVGAEPALVRPPYCGAPGRVATAASWTGTRYVVLRSIDPAVVLRSIDPADWRATDPDDLAERVLADIGPGDIVCLHDGVAPTNSGTPARDVTAAAVRLLVPALLERGLRPVTVSELLR
jgi:peptidoglycan-N-acetylglucosamine deacetylase